jgi:hypothetical protein
MCHLTNGRQTHRSRKLGIVKNMAAELFLYKLAQKLGKKLGGKNNGGSGSRIGSIAANLAWQ